MTQRSRKLLGILALVASIVGYCILVGALYASFFGGQPWWVLIGFFAIAGLGWFFPATWIIRWMSRPDGA